MKCVIKLSKHEMLAKAIRIASKVHEKQFDKGGNPYILHPLHVMQQLLYDTELAVIGVLHDVIEDSDGEYTVQRLADEGFSIRVLTALEMLTHDHDQSYEDYIDAICYNYDAIRVKRKDLQHNSDITRLKGLRKKDFDRLEKYARAFKKLGIAKRKFQTLEKDDV